MSEGLRDFYDQKYSQRELERSFESDVSLRRRTEYAAYMLKKLKSIYHINTILDVGSADGKVAEFIKSQTGLKIILSDISETLLAESKTGDKVTADAQNLPFNSNSFDAVYSLQVLEHMLKWEKALDEIIRVSKSFVILSTDVCTSRTYHFKPEFNADGHCHVFGLRELRGLLERKNLKILNICFPVTSKRLWKITNNQKVINWIESGKIMQLLIKIRPRFRRVGLEALYVCKKQGEI